MEQKWLGLSLGLSLLLLQLLSADATARQPGDYVYSTPLPVCVGYQCSGYWPPPARQAELTSTPFPSKPRLGRHIDADIVIPPCDVACEWQDTHQNPQASSNEEASASKSPATAFQSKTQPQIIPVALPPCETVFPGIDCFTPPQPPARNTRSGTP